MSSVVGCDPGNYCPPRSVTQLPCPRGHASANVNASVCSPCQLGYSAPETGMTQCTICPAGSYANTFGASACTTCGSGFTSVAGATSSAQCIGNNPTAAIIDRIIVYVLSIGGSTLLFLLGVWLRSRQNDRTWAVFDGYCIANNLRKSLQLNIGSLADAKEQGYVESFEVLFMTVYNGVRGRSSVGGSASASAWSPIGRDASGGGGGGGGGGESPGPALSKSMRKEMSVNLVAVEPWKRKKANRTANMRDESLAIMLTPIDSETEGKERNITDRILDHDDNGVSDDAIHSDDGAAECFLIIDSFSKAEQGRYFRALEEAIRAHIDFRPACSSCRRCFSSSSSSSRSSSSSSSSSSNAKGRHAGLSMLHDGKVTFPQSYVLGVLPLPFPCCQTYEFSEKLFKKKIAAIAAETVRILMQDTLQTVSSCLTESNSTLNGSDSSISVTVSATTDRDATCVPPTNTDAVVTASSSSPNGSLLTDYEQL